MSLAINHNLMASNTAGNLNRHFATLSTSVRRLSSGLRVGQASDDAAGLGIRELMRAEIAGLSQGVRNANDAISLIQTADGALAIIDEKLIRMKELAEQAATGTYTSDQRLMINSEFQAMADEIDRIAASTDFNGVHLLDGTLSGVHNGSGLNSTGALKVHFGSGNDSAEDYYYLDIGKVSARSLLFGPGAGAGASGNAADFGITWPGAEIVGNKVILKIEDARAGFNPAAAQGGYSGLDYYVLPVGLKNITMRAIGEDYAPHKAHIMMFTKSGEQLTGVNPADKSPYNFVMGDGDDWWDSSNSGITTGADVIAADTTGSYFNPGAVYKDSIINFAGQTVTAGGMTVTIKQSQWELGASNVAVQEEIHVSEITDDLVFFIGGHVTAICNMYSLEIVAELDEQVFGDMLRANASMSISTQDQAQQMLEHIDRGIINKDKIRAHLGAMQNRLENTVSNLQIQAENLQAAESRISDVDVASEMTAFISSQIKTQAAVAMLAQANSLTNMALGLMQGG